MSESSSKSTQLNSTQLTQPIVQKTHHVSLTFLLIQIQTVSIKAGCPAGACMVHSTSGSYDISDHLKFVRVAQSSNHRYFSCSPQHSLICYQLQCHTQSRPCFSNVCRIVNERMKKFQGRRNIAGREDGKPADYKWRRKGGSVPNKDAATACL
mmetsp:Transcript_3482/g.5876  ORF Transcript_3482/g.5876 Transcript_3482/m.5876 type:complete len:153 (-) Transcript_3482:3282-3740(-)